MGRQKKAFVDKRKAITYCLLPTPQALESAPGNTWVRTDSNLEIEDPFTTLESTVGRPNVVSPTEPTELISAADIGGKYNDEEVTLSPVEKIELGIPDDGYDYAKHLRVCSGALGAAIEPEPSTDTHSHRESNMFASSLPCTSSRDESYAEDTSSSSGEDLAETLRALDALSMVNEQLGIPCGDLQDNIFQLANETINDTPAATNVARFATSVRRHPQAACTATKNVRSILKKESIEPLDETFEQMLKGYGDDAIGACETKLMAHSLAAINASGSIHIAPSSSKATAVEPFQSHILHGVTQELATERRELRSHTAADVEEDSLGQNIARQVYDCESVLSVHSNVMHHPKLLQDKREIRSKQVSDKCAAAQPNAEREINFSCLKESDLGDWRSSTSRKGESIEEKKERKAAVRRGRKEARQQKKQLKDAFRSAARPVCMDSADVTNGVSCKRF
jgi:protein LTV1